jgi:hypothetical protein
MSERVTFAIFQDECRKLAAERVFSSAWEMSFSSEDFDREWIVTARSGTLTASIRVFSASVTPTASYDAVIGLGRMLIEMQTGEPEITPKQRAILDELTAEAGKHGSGTDC